MALSKLYDSRTHNIKKVAGVWIRCTEGKDYRDPSKECVQVWADVDGKMIGLEEWNDVFLSLASPEDLYRFYASMVSKVERLVQDEVRNSQDAKLGFGFVG